MNKIYIKTTAAEKKNNLWKTINTRCRQKVFKKRNPEFGIIAYCGFFTNKKLCNSVYCLKFSYALYKQKRNMK